MLLSKTSKRLHLSPSDVILLLNCLFSKYFRTNFVSLKQLTFRHVSFQQEATVSQLIMRFAGVQDATPCQVVTLFFTLPVIKKQEVFKRFPLQLLELTKTEQPVVFGL